MKVKKLFGVSFCLMLITMLIDQIVSHLQGAQDLIADTMLFKISFIGMAVFGTIAILAKGKEK